MTDNEACYGRSRNRDVRVMVPYKFYIDTVFVLSSFSLLCTLHTGVGPHMVCHLVPALEMDAQSIEVVVLPEEPHGVCGPVADIPLEDRWPLTYENQVG